MDPTTTVIKKEKDDEPANGPTPAEIEARIVELCQEFPKGITGKILENSLQNVDPKNRIIAINNLLNQVSEMLYYH